MASGSRSIPLKDIGSLLKIQNDATPLKPKFLSKAEREKQALQKREAELKQQRDREREGEQQRRQFLEKAQSVFGNRHSTNGSGYSHRAARYDGQQPPTTLDYDDHPGGFRDRRGQNAASVEKKAEQATVDDISLTSEEREVIRNKYLGIQAPAKKRSRTERKKMAFDWDATDDTSDSLHPALFSKGVEASTFGAGGRAGMDIAQTNGALSSTNGNIGDPLRRGAKSAFAEKHWSEKPLDEMRERDWRIFREDFGISSKGGHIPKPLRSWQESSIPPAILSAIEGIGYKEPSPIQRQAIPIGLQNRDLIGIAETGSGKTASFVIPMLTYISKLPRLSEATRHLGPYALIVSPTRELAQQIEVETKKFTDQLGYNCVSIVGGRDMNDQAFSLRNGAEIIVATPGRLKDCIERHILVLSQCLYLVLDEADKSIGLGFADTLDYILDSMPASNLKPDTEAAENPLTLLGEEEAPRYRVTMLYSATMPPSVERLAKTYLRRPATITIGDANQAVGTVEQRVEFIASDDKKKQRLMQILSSRFEPPIIVFSTTIASVDNVAHTLRREGFNVTTLHSKKTQTQREESLASLRSGQSDVLVATDLAGRGIDVPDVSAVINYSFPTSFEAYIHRIGRTGRAGKKGVAFTFVDPQHDAEFLYDLKQELVRSPVSTVPRELDRHPAAQSRMASRDKRRRDEEN
jgi:ATP-dependent RNA helicase DDX23/PRP28